MFDENLIQTDFSLEDFVSALFAEIEVRRQEQLMARIKTAHEMFFSDEKKDYSFACFELLWVALSEECGFAERNPFVCRKSGETVLLQLRELSRDAAIPEFASYVERKWNRLVIPWTINGRHVNYITDPVDVPKLLLLYYCQICPNNAFAFSSQLSQEAKYNQNITELKKFIELLKILK